MIARKDRKNKPATIDYAEGFGDGIEETLRQLLGTSDVATKGMAPQEFVGPELREWATDALARLDSARVEAEGIVR